MLPRLPHLRHHYPQIAKDLLAPLLEVLRAGREVCGGDLDKLLITLMVAMRTLEHKEAESLSLEAVLKGEIDIYPSLSTNVRSISDSSGIPKESVRRKVQALVEDGWIIRTDNSLSLAPHASRMLTPFRDELLQLAIRYYNTLESLPPPDDG
jgi:hypothetical protein